MLPPPTLLELVTVCVLIVWIGASAIGAVTHDLELVTLTTPLLTALVTGLVALSITRRNGNGRNGKT